MLSVKQTEKNTYNFIATSSTIFWQIVCLIFMVSKITGYITWSWWWVFAPIWGPFALVVGITAALLSTLLLISVICWALEEIMMWLQRRRQEKNSG